MNPSRGFPANAGGVTVASGWSDHQSSGSAIDALAESGAPLLVVRGNCDAHPWPLALDLRRAGRRVHLVHIPPRRPPPGAELVLHGHTHVPRDETDPLGVRWLNPGCITRPNRGAPAAFAWLHLENGHPAGWLPERL